MSFIQTYQFGRLTSSAMKGIFIYFLVLGLLIGASFVHGLVVALIETAFELLGSPVEILGFAPLMYQANKLFLLFLMLPLGVVIIGILIVNAYFPLLASWVVELANGIFKTLNIQVDFTSLIYRDIEIGNIGAGSINIYTFDSSVITQFYFDFVNAMSDVLLTLSIFGDSAKDLIL